MINIVELESDGLNSIILVRDSYKGVVVQNIRFTKSLQPNHAGILEEFTSKQVVDTNICSVLDKNFKANVASAISKARQKMVEIQNLDKIIEGTFVDYGGKKD